MKIAFLDRASLDFGDIDLDPLRSEHQLQCFSHTAASEVDARITEMDVLIVNKVVIDAKTLARHPKLKLICIAATGTNNVDLEAAARQGVVVCNCQGYGTSSVAQHVFSLLLALATRLVDYQRAVARGDWGRSEQFCLLDYPVMELRGKTLGIIGYGVLGQEVARLARAFGMEVLVASRPGQPLTDGRIPLVEMLPRVDVLSLHCPLTADTRGVIGAQALASMKAGALLINASRGGVVDEQALRQSLLDGHLGGAGVDVLSEEPPRAGNPLLDSSIPNLIITPHSAWGSREARQTIVHQLAENIDAFEQGLARRVVN